MKTCRKVLVATDLSLGSDEAVRRAAAVARRSGAALAVCHVVPNALRASVLFPQLNVPEPTSAVALTDRAAEAVAGQVSRVAALERSSYELFVAEGAPDARVVAAAEEWAADLVVVGASGRSATERLLLGSVAERVVRHASVPVLVARPGNGRGVLAATDLSDPSLPALSAGAAEAREAGCRLLAMHALELSPGLVADATAAFGGGPLPPPPELVDQMRALAVDSLTTAVGLAGAPDAEVVVAEGPAAAAVLAAATARDVDVVVIGTTGKTGLARLLLGSVAEAVVRTAPCSVLVVRAAAGPSAEAGPGA